MRKAQNKMKPKNSRLLIANSARFLSRKNRCQSSDVSRGCSLGSRIVAACLIGAFFASFSASAEVLGFFPPPASGVAWTTVTCGSTTTAFGVTGQRYLTVQIPAGGQTVGFAWGTASATLAAPSEVYTGGTTIQWGGGTGSCIVASGTQAIAVGVQ